MCGIAGIYYQDTQRPVDPLALRAMADAVAHRGPDAEGFWSEPGVGLAHRRLSIIDLAGGDQPLANEDDSIQVVFNGEIYNFQELRSQLESRGHQFRTDSDTEVLVHLYEDDGERLVERLRGMFAFALWDTRRRRLLLARDRIGLKPLYVYRDGEKLLFGSEIKAILAYGDVDRTIDPRAIEDYLTFGFIPGERTIFSHVKKLPAGHTLLIDDDLGAPLRRYWRYEPRIDHTRSIDDWLAAIDAKFTETTAAHRIADVPVGAFLSGGLDSSAVVTALSHMPEGSPQTFSIGFEREDLSELPYARQVAERFGCRHTEQMVTAEAAASLDDLVHYYDEPFADSSAIPTMLVSQLAREHVKVVLSGDGGDEAFGGYSRYAFDLQEAGLRRKLPGWFRRHVLASIAGAWPKADWLPRPLRAKTRLTNLSLPADQAYANTLAVSRLPGRRNVLHSDVLAELDGHRPEQIVLDHFAAAPAGDALAGMIAADVGVLLPDDFLTKVDRASMSCGLEVRPPLVDHELLELAATIPSELKVREGETKWIFKHLYRDRLPRDITARPKQGFEIPTDAWLHGPLRDVFESSVLAPSAPAAAWLDQGNIARLYRAHQARVGRHGNQLWSLLVLSRWAEQYATSAQPAEPRKATLAG